MLEQKKLILLITMHNESIYINLNYKMYYKLYFLYKFLIII